MIQTVVGCSYSSYITLIKKHWVTIPHFQILITVHLLVFSLQSRAVLRMTLLMSRSVPARWTWPGSPLCCQTGSLPTTACSCGTPATTWTSPPLPTTSTSHIWGSTPTTASWCKHTHALGLGTTAVIRWTSLHWRMVRRLGRGGRERGRVCFQIQDAARLHHDRVRRASD